MYKAGDIFPSQDDLIRLQQYEDNKKMFENKQWELFIQQAQELRRQRKIPKRYYSDLEDIYIAVPIVMEMPKLVSDLLFRNKPLIDISDSNTSGQTLADEVVKENKLHTRLLEYSIDCAVKSGVVMKTYLEAGKSKIKFIQPDKYFIHRDIKGEIDEHIISWEFKVDNKPYRYIETHKLNKAVQNEEGIEGTDTWWIYYQVFSIKGNKLDRQHKVQEFFPDLPDSEDTKLSTCSIIYVPYFRAMDNYFGYSIYFGLESLFDELNTRLSHLSKLFSKYSDPTVTGPPLDEDEDEDERGIIQRGTTVRERYIERDSSDVPDVNYVTWDGKVEGHIKYIKEVIFTIIYICTPINPSLYGLDTSGTVSGKAIKLKSFRTDCTVDRWSNYFIEGIQQAIYNCMEYQRAWVNSSVKSEYPDVTIVKGFSRDTKEEADTEQVRLAAGNTSVVSSIMRLDRCTKEKAEEEYKKILEEQKKAQENVSNTRKTLNLFGDNGGGS